MKLARVLFVSYLTMIVAGAGGDLRDRRAGPMGQLRDNSLSPVFGLLLLITLAAQSIVGLDGYNNSARTDGLAELDWWRYVTSSSFAVDVAENWQSEYLPFTLYILLTVWLVQRGSSESKPPTRPGRTTTARSGWAPSPNRSRRPWSGGAAGGRSSIRAR